MFILALLTLIILISQ
ncbi:MAG: hypothetical protein NC321_16850 [Clostridium sp.]|nr:hypothetical protein [Clostridium sp.]